MVLGMSKRGVGGNRAGAGRPRAPEHMKVMDIRLGAPRWVREALEEIAGRTGRSYSSVGSEVLVAWLRENHPDLVPTELKGEVKA